MSLSLTVHRSAHTIGGNCIELALGGERLILDVGRPLDAPNGATGLLPETLDRAAPATVLISHPHQDHYGLLAEASEHWPVWCGAAAEKLIRLSAGFAGGTIARTFGHYRDREPLALGPFTVTPFLVDHSAFDAHMLLIEGAGRRVLYTGDFRAHGRKASLVERLMRHPPPGIDVLLMEGTNLGSAKPAMPESALEEDFAQLFRETPGRVFVAWSAQNVDRTVTLFRAAKRTGRTLVVDLYTAEVMELLAEHGRLPRPGWDGLKVVITGRMGGHYERRGQGAFVSRMAKGGHAIGAAALAADPGRWVVMARGSLLADYASKGVTPTADDAWSWSQWGGYLPTIGAELAAWMKPARAKHIHTSGHASPADLRAFAAAIAPRWMVPIHGLAWDEAHEGFPPIRRLGDGERWEL